MNTTPKLTSPLTLSLSKGLICVICGLFLLSLSQGFAQTGTPIVVNGTNYVPVSGTVINTTTNAAYPVYVYNHGTLNGANNWNLSTAGASAYGVYISGTSQFTGTNLTVSTTGISAYGIYVLNSSTATITGGTIGTAGSSAHSIYINGTSSGSFDEMTIRTEGANGNSVSVTNSSTLNLVNSSIVNSGSESGSNVIRLSGTSIGNVSDVTINGNGANAVVILASSTFSGNRMSIAMVGGDGFRVEGNRSIGTLTDSSIDVTNASGVVVSGAPGATAYINNSLVNVSGGPVTNPFYIRQEAGFAAFYMAAASAASGTQSLFVNGGTYTASGGRSAVSINALASTSTTANVDAVGTVYVLDVKGGALLQSDDLAFNIASIKTGTTSSGLMPVDLKTVATITISEASHVIGGISNKDTAVVDFTFSDSSSLTGDVLASGSSTTNVNLDNSTLTGKTTRNDNSVLNITVDNSSVWNVTGDSNLTKLVNNGVVDFQYTAGSFKTLTTDNMNGSGVFKMNTLIGTDITPNHNGDIGAAGDLIVVNGTSAGTHQIIIKRQGGNGNASGDGMQLLLVQSGTTTGSFTGNTDAHQYSGAVDIGMRTAQVQRGDLSGNNPNNWYLVLSATNSGTNGGGGDNGGGNNNGGGGTPTIGGGGHVVLASAKARSTAWFDQDTLVKRMGELRLNDGIFNDMKGHDWEAWVRSFGSQYNMGSKVTGYGNYSQTIYGVDLGADKAWNIDKRNVIYTGVFGGYERSDLDFKYNGSDGGMDGYNMGFYATWLHDTGWYADWVGRAMYQNNDYKAHDNSTNSMNGSYDGWAAGTSLEFGRQFQFKDGWYAEPQVQASYVHFFGSNYSTSGDNAFGINVQDQDTLQIRFGSLLGRTIKLSKDANDKGFIQPYVKVFGVEQISDGGDVVTGDGRWKANTDGMSAIIGAGIVYQIDTVNQLHLDYEAQFSDKYDKPFGVNFGYRHQF